SATRPADVYSLSLHDALPIFETLLDALELGGALLVLFERALHLIEISNQSLLLGAFLLQLRRELFDVDAHFLELGQELLHSSFRSEEHTSELQSRENLVCRLL